MTEQNGTPTAPRNPDSIITTQRNGQTIVAGYFSITAAQKHSATSCSRRYLPTVRVYLRLTVKSRKNRKSCDNSRPDDTFHVRAVFIVKNAVFSSQEPEKTPEKCPYCVTGAQKGACMRTGLTKQEKTTDIWFDEKDPIIHIRTHNIALKKASACIQPPLSGDLPADRRRPGNGLHGV